jgi:hypothetical protein
LIRAQRDVTTTLVGCNDPLVIKCVDMRNNEVMQVNVAQAVVATMNSWCALDRTVSQSAVARELLNEGCLLSNLKGIFYNPKRFRAQESQASDGAALFALRRAGEIGRINHRASSH